MWWDLEVGCLGGNWVTGVKRPWVGLDTGEIIAFCHVKTQKVVICKVGSMPSTKHRTCQCLELGFQPSDLRGLNFCDLSYQSRCFVIAVQTDKDNYSIFEVVLSYVFSYCHTMSDYLPLSLYKRANRRLF